jgi:hypothetical protein
MVAFLPIRGDLDRAAPPYRGGGRILAAGILLVETI